MQIMRTNTKYGNMSYLWYINTITIGLSAIISKNKKTHKNALITIGVLTAAEIINKIYKKYCSTNNVATVANSVVQLATLYYSSSVMPILIATNKDTVFSPINPLIRALNYYQITLQSISNLAFKITTIGIVCSAILYPLIRLYMSNMINSLTPQIRTIVNMIQTVIINGITVEQNGVRVFNTRSVIVEQNMIQQLAPVRAMGLNNVIDESNHYTHPLNCSVCSELFQTNSLYRVLPCNHAFHAPCIDTWLQSSNATCPVCRHDIRDPHINNANTDANIDINQPIDDNFPHVTPVNAPGHVHINQPIDANNELFRLHIANGFLQLSSTLMQHVNRH